jgi:queuine tRNA-ribosyltransferase
VDHLVSTHVSRTYSLGYIRHLFQVWETLGWQLLSLHNLEFLLNLSREARRAIWQARFSEFRDRFLTNLRHKG